ncbi:MAG: AmmeMemoRadiSam system protein B [Nanobdellota archaeon]
MRQVKFAGMFYPDDKNELTEMINGFLETVEHNNHEGHLKAIIVPHAGYVFSGQTAAYAYKLIPESIKRVILIGPSHQYAFRGIASSGEDWQTPLGKVKVIPLENDMVKIDERPHDKEHSLEVQLPFLQRMIGEDVEVMMLSTNETHISRAAKMLEEMLDSETLLVISTDLSHFYDEETAKNLDDQTSKDILQKNLDALDHDEACGLEGVKIAVELARKNDWKIKELHRSTSADVTGDRERVVGYGSYGIFTRG